MQTTLARLREKGISTVESCLLSEHSSFRIGGAARVAIFPETRNQLLESLGILREYKQRFLLIGNASNVVFSDEGFDGFVIFTSRWKALSVQGEQMTVVAGTPLTTVAKTALEHSLGGAEFTYGIPGTAGGAVFMNAGAFGGCMEQICVSSEYYDIHTGEIVTLRGDAQQFGTRTSFYETHPEAVILGAVLQLQHGDAEEIRGRMSDFLQRRKNTQPLEYPSAGSVFKRPAGHFAGKLIEDCGLKGLTVGGAQVSEKHAGFIVNRGGATAEDVKRLVEQIKETVLRQTGVMLECEIRFL